MEERQVSVDGNTHPLPDEFFVIATQNPVDQLGAYPLPESQLDRFLVGIELGYPDASTERELLQLGDQRARITSLSGVANPAVLHQWCDDAEHIHTAAPVLDYIQALLTKSRDGAVGLSPRAGLNLVRLSRAYALVQGRDHVLIDDVQNVFPALAGHRLTGRVKSGIDAAAQVLNSVAVP